MRRVLSLLCLLSLLPSRAGSEPPAAGKSDEAAPVAFRDDARLQKKVTLAYKDAPLGELLGAVGREVKVRLTASRDTADDKVTLFLDDRPAAEALSLIARHLDFQWYRVETGYELNQKAGSKRREAALRGEERARQVAAIRERMNLLE